jgi:hypothetical protein
MGRTCGTNWEKRNAYRDLMGNLKKRDHLEDLVVDGMMTLKQIFKKQDGRACTGLIWLRRGRSGGLLWTR